MQAMESRKLGLDDRLLVVWPAGDKARGCDSLSRTTHAGVLNGLSSSTPKCLKSATFRVTTIKLRVLYGRNPCEYAAMRAGLAQLGDDVGVKQLHAPAKARRRMSARVAALRKRERRARQLRQQQLLQRRSCRHPQPAPLVHRYENCSFRAALRDHLRSLGQALLKELAEPGFCILNGPYAQGRFLFRPVI